MFYQFCFIFIGKDEVFHGLLYTIMRVLRNQKFPKHNFCQNGALFLNVHRNHSWARFSGISVTPFTTTTVRLARQVPHRYFIIRISLLDNVSLKWGKCHFHFRFTLCACILRHGHSILNWLAFATFVTFLSKGEEEKSPWPSTRTLQPVLPAALSRAWLLL